MPDNFERPADRAKKPYVPSPEERRGIDFIELNWRIRKAIFVPGVGLIASGIVGGLGGPWWLAVPLGALTSLAVWKVGKASGRYFDNRGVNPLLPRDRNQGDTGSR